MKKDLLFCYVLKLVEKRVKRVLRLFTWACCASFFGLSMVMPITTIAINYWTRMKTISWLLRTELAGPLFIWLFQPVLSSLFSWLRKNSSRAVSLVGGSACVAPSQLAVKILVKKLSSTLLTCLRRVIVVWLCSQVVAVILLMLRWGCGYMAKVKIMPVVHQGPKEPGRT